MRMTGRLSPGTEPRTGSKPGVPRPYVGAPLVQVDSDAGPLWLRADDGVILPYVVQNGTWEPGEGELLRTYIRPGTTFVDVGANVGYFSRLAATCEPARIIAFEPHPELVEVLALNVWGLEPVVEVVTAALGDSNGTVALSSADHNYGDTRVSAGGAAPSTMVAAVVRMDDMISGRVDVVKIDVQGYESEVLRGMQRIILENPQIVMIVEFWPSAIEARGLVAKEVLTDYQTMGFDVYLLLGGSPATTTLQEILAFCQSAGPDGQANLVLHRR